jgi:hypothetical protein
MVTSSSFRDRQVDIEPTTDTGGGYLVGWTKAGEWTTYTLTAPQTGTYTAEVRVAANGPGGTFHLEFQSADKTGPIQIPDTACKPSGGVAIRDLL